MINIRNLTKKFAKDPLFEDLNLIIHEGEKIALVGQNGTGKSTLVRCISGLEDYEGTIDVENMKICLMEQERYFEGLNETFEEYLEKKEQAIMDFQSAVKAKLEDPKTYESEERNTQVMEEYEKAMRQAESIEMEKIKVLLKSLNFEMKDYEKKISTLSGGQKTKLRIAECLAKKADIYILDEPTNNLDLETLAWLEKEVQKRSSTFLIISHDRYFLKNTVEKVIEIEDKKLQIYMKNYEGYLTDRAHHFTLLEDQHKKLERKRKKLLDSAKEKREWAKKKGSKTMRILAERLERDAAKIPEITSPVDFIRKFEMGFEIQKDTRKVIFDFTDLKKSFGAHKLFEDINLEINDGERIAIVGKNGSGKSTFLKILCGLEEKTAGEIHKGPSVEIGYFDQEFKDLDNNQTIGDFFQDLFPSLHESHLKALMEKFGIDKERSKGRIKDLSGGEKARINLVRLMVLKKNVLLLDEPTNNIDIELMEALENALKDYPGTIVFVSHDRQFIDNIATRIFKLENQRMTSHKGNFTDNFS